MLQPQSHGGVLLSCSPRLPVWALIRGLDYAIVDNYVATIAVPLARKHAIFDYQLSDARTTYPVLPGKISRAV
jgi:hypothetical protein